MRSHTAPVPPCRPRSCRGRCEQRRAPSHIPSRRRAALAQDRARGARERRRAPRGGHRALPCRARDGSEAGRTHPAHPRRDRTVTSPLSISGARPLGDHVRIRGRFAELHVERMEEPAEGGRIGGGRTPDRDPRILRHMGFLNRSARDWGRDPRTSVQTAQTKTFESRNFSCNSPELVMGADSQ